MTSSSRSLAQEGFAAGEGHVEGRTAQAGEDLLPLVDAEIVVGLAPHIAGAALAVAAKADTDHDREGFDLGPAKCSEGPVEGQFGNQSNHGRCFAFWPAAGQQESATDNTDEKG
jgi:hypothetical protein